MNKEIILEQLVKEFKRPNITKIKKGKEPIKKACNSNNPFHEIYSYLKEINENQYLIVKPIDDSSFLPFKIINWENFQKMSNHLKTPRYNSKHEVRKEKPIIRKDLKSKVDSAKNKSYWKNKIITGYDFRNFADFNSVVFIEKCIRAAHLFAFNEINKTELIKAVKEKGYSSRDFPDRSPSYLFKVPSLDRKKVGEFYTIAFYYIPTGKDKFVKQYSLTADCACDFDRIKVTHKGKKKPEFFCVHKIAAYFYLANEYMKKGNKDLMKLSPFIFPSQQLVDYYNFVLSHLIIDENGKSKIINYSTLEAILMEKIIDEGSSLISTKNKFVDYNW